MELTKEVIIFLIGPVLAQPHLQQAILKVKADIENTHFISILSAGSIDNGIIEEEIVYICYLLDNKPVANFAGIKNLNKADAEGFLNAIVEVLKL